MRRLNFKRGTAPELQVQFGRVDPVTGTWTAELLPVGTVLVFGLKETGSFDGYLIVSTDVWTVDGYYYVGQPSFNNAALNALLLSPDGNASNDKPSVTLMGELSWGPDGDDPTPTSTFEVLVANKVINGDEPAPTPGPFLTRSVTRVTEDGSTFNYAAAADTDVARGEAFTAALAASSAGDVIICGPGVHELETGVTLSHEITILGQGSATRFFREDIEDEEDPVFTITSGSVRFRDLLVEGQTPFSINPAGAAVTYNGIELWNVSAEGTADVLAFGANTTATVDCFSCDFESGYDYIANNSGSSGGVIVRVHGGRLYSVEQGGIGMTAGRVEITGANISWYQTLIGGGELHISGSTLAVAAGGNISDVSAGTLTIGSTTMRGSANIGGVGQSGGTVRLEGLKIDTSADATRSPLTKSGGTMTLAHCTLVAHATRDSISAPSAQNVAAWGCYANKAVDGDVTITIGTAGLTVDADVV